jgi:leucyl aminopeptidase
MNSIQIGTTNSVPKDIELLVVFASDLADVQSNCLLSDSTNPLSEDRLASLMVRLLKDQSFDFQGDKGFFYPFLNRPQDYAVKGVLFVPFPQDSNAEDASLQLIVADGVKKACNLVHDYCKANEISRIVVSLSPRSHNTALLTAALLQSKQGLDVCMTKEQHALKQVLYHGSSLPEQLVTSAKALSDGLDLAKKIILLPPNLKRPVKLAEEIKELFEKQQNFSIELLDRAALEALGCGGIVGVGKAGSPVLCKVTYTPDFPYHETKALVLKGVTMDTGGYGVKPALSQEDWKGDCAGAATGLGALLALGRLKAPSKIVAFVPLVENLISGDALLFGEVLTMANGLTVEVGHTDAEGRLILADALALASREASTIVDMATLTGVCATVLGKKIAGLFCNSDSLADALIEAGQQAGERFHRFPIEKALYGDMLKGRVADLRNINSAGPDLLLTACFLSNFVQDGIQWAHIDFAGPALDGIDHGTVNGFGVLTLVNLLA